MVSHIQRNSPGAARDGRPVVLCPIRVIPCFKVHFLDICDIGLLLACLLCYVVTTHIDGSRDGYRVFAAVCMSFLQYCMYPKPIQLGSSNLTYTSSAMSPGNPLISVSEVEVISQSASRVGPCNIVNAGFVSLL